MQSFLNYAGWMMIRFYYVENGHRPEIREWCVKSFGELGGGRWGCSRADMRNMRYHSGQLWKFWFSIEEDAVLFKMTWEIEDF